MITYHFLSVLYECEAVSSRLFDPLKRYLAGNNTHAYYSAFIVAHAQREGGTEKGGLVPNCLLF